MNDILDYINNYFAVTKEKATFNINNNSIIVKEKYLKGQYIKLEGSILNDGIYKVESVGVNTIGITGLIDEEFEGFIYGLAIPKNIINIANKYEIQKEEASNSILESESFDNYSYSIAKDTDGQVYNTLDSFKKDLRKYRQMRDNSLNKARLIE